MITLIGMGSGTPESLTAQGLAALQNAGLILGAKRLLEQLPQGCTEHRKALYQPEDVLAALAADPEVDAALVYSGDTGFYSGAAQLLPMLRAFGISCRVLPGLSSVQLLAAAVGRSWQEWKLVSAHGCACDPVAECLTAGGKPVFFLTGGAETPASLCSRLAAAGLGDAHVLVGEELGRAEEKILFGTAQEFAQKQFASLSVLLVEHLPQPPRRVPGFPDEAFHRGEVPMTKQEVRAAALAKLAVQPGDTLWDVGAGTGSVSVELALAAPRGHVYAVECDPCGGNYEHMTDTLIACYKVLIAKAKAKGIKVYGGTITPTKGNGWYSFWHEAMRQTVNEWIRKSGAFDEVIDFDELTRDPKDPQRLKAEYSDDWLHLNPKGYEAMGKFAAEKLK